MKYYTFLVFGSFLLNVFQNFDRQEIFEKKKGRNIRKVIRCHFH